MVKDELAALQTALRQVQDVLEQRGVHPPSCQKGVGIGVHKPPRECSCGIDEALALLPALEPTPVDKPYVDICRTPFEAFGHNESCGRWVEGPGCILLDHEQACTCGGVELDPDGPALDGPR